MMRYISMLLLIVSCSILASCASVTDSQHSGVIDLNSQTSDCPNELKWSRDGFFTEMDADRDGNVALKEYTASHAKKFNEMDKDHDGYVSKEEYLEYWCGKKPVSNNDIVDSNMKMNTYSGCIAYWSSDFQMMDTDNDGRIALEDVIKFYSNDFNKIDVKIKGSINKNDFDKYMDGECIKAAKPSQNKN